MENDVIDEMIGENREADIEADGATRGTTAPTGDVVAECESIELESVEGGEVVDTSREMLRAFRAVDEEKGATSEGMCLIGREVRGKVEANRCAIDAVVGMGGIGGKNAEKVVARAILGTDGSGDGGLLLTLAGMPDGIGEPRTL